ncbi:S-layer homology domain-containing protein [Egicoccus sp. AB-alg2]|uniref:S-layer homology domain-containing protein n=1 Tax=Egicoccus sp. AB-alg2 TaxID=3242693 RepID=UPI00359E56A0
MRLRRPAVALAVAGLLAAALPTPAALAAQPRYDIDRACPANTVPVAGFTDISEPHDRGIDCLAWFRIANGVTETTFDQTRPVNRGEAASFLVRLLRSVDGVQLPAPKDGAFRDVRSGPHKTNIEILAAMRNPVLRGFQDGGFRPTQPIQRDQFASIVVRAMDEVARQSSSVSPLPTTSRRPFSDVRTGPHAENVNRLAQANILQGTRPGTFAPTSAIQRGQTASVLARTLGGLVDAGVSARPVLVSGTVHDASDVQPGTYGRALTNATVTITGTADLTTRTNTQGRYQVWLRPGQYEITVAPSGHVPFRRAVEVVRATPVTVDFGVYRTATAPAQATPTTSGAQDVTVSADGNFWVVAPYRGAERTRFLPTDASEIVLVRPDGVRVALGAAGTSHAWFSRNADGTSERVGAQVGVHRVYYLVDGEWVRLDATFDAQGRLTHVNGQAYNG